MIAADRYSSSYYARNRGVAGGTGEWILFLDADVTAPSDIVEHYFTETPRDRTGLLVGEVVDEAPRTDAGALARHAWLRQPMAQGNTVGFGRWAYAQTANCAVRRSAFEEASGFRENIRSAGDADLCFRLRELDWGLERREEARVVHRARTSLPALLRQKARHGSGIAWINRVHPGSFPFDPVAVGAVSARSVAAALSLLVRRRPGTAVLACLDLATLWAYQLGRLLPNRVRPR